MASLHSRHLVKTSFPMVAPLHSLQVYWLPSTLGLHMTKAERNASSIKLKLKLKQAGVGLSLWVPVLRCCTMELVVPARQTPLGLQNLLALPWGVRCSGWGCAQNNQGWRAAVHG